MTHDISATETDRDYGSVQTVEVGADHADVLQIGLGMPRNMPALRLSRGPNFIQE